MRMYKYKYVTSDGRNIYIDSCNSDYKEAMFENEKVLNSIIESKARVVTVCKMKEWEV